MKIIIHFLFTACIILASSASAANQVDLIQKTRNLLADKEALYNEIYNATGSKLRTEKIVGGSFASRGQYREFTTILIYDFNGNIEGICGGTLISRNKVLTAAHCVYGKLSSNILAIPAFYTFNDPPENYDIFGISSRSIHPRYNDNIANGFDIAVLTLDGSASTPRASIYGGQLSLTNQRSQIIGMGRIGANADSSATLKRATVPVVSNAVCQNSNTGSGITIKSSMLCAGYPQGGTGTCPGDSGGPLFVTVNGRRTQAGITSFGIPCARSNSYDVYTRVSSFISFITDKAPGTNIIYSSAPPPNNNSSNAFIPPILLLLDE